MHSLVVTSLSVLDIQLVKHIQKPLALVKINMTWLKYINAPGDTLLVKV